MGRVLHSRVEAEAEAVEAAEPEVAAAAAAVGAVERPAGGLDAGVADGLGREGEGPLADELQAGRLGAPAVEQIEHDLGPEPRRGHAETRVAEAVRHLPLHGGAPELAEAGRGVDHPAPRVAELHAGQLREGGEEVLGQLRPRLRALLELLRHLAAEVVDGVVATPQDPVVLREPVVVELVGHVGEALSAHPTDRRPLVRRQGLRRERVVVDRRDVVLHAPQQRREGVGAQRDLARADTAEGRRGHDPDAVVLDARDLRVLVDPHAQRLGRGLEPPHQAGGVDERRPVPPPQAGAIGGGVDLGLHGLLVEQLDVLA